MGNLKLNKNFKTMHKVYVNRPDHFFFYSVKMTADFCNFQFETVMVD